MALNVFLSTQSPAKTSAPPPAGRPAFFATMASWLQVAAACEKFPKLSLMVNTLLVTPLGFVPVVGFLRHHTQLVPGDGFHLVFAHALKETQRLKVAYAGFVQVALLHCQRAELTESYTLSPFIISLFFAIQVLFHILFERHHTVLYLQTHVPSLLCRLPIRPITSLVS